MTINILTYKGLNVNLLDKSLCGISIFVLILNNLLLNDNKKKKDWTITAIGDIIYSMVSAKSASQNIKKDADIMKKVLLAAMLCGAVCCAGCDEASQAESSNIVTNAATTTISTTTNIAAETTIAVETTTVTDTVAEPTTQAPLVAPAEDDNYPLGTWLDVTNTESVYVFRADGSGAIRSLETGTGVPFQTEFDAAKSVLTFHIGSADETEKATVISTDEPVITLDWAEREDITLEFIGEGEEKFYTYDELGKMALDYYAAKNGTKPQSYSIESASDGRIAIQIFENQDDHTASLDWYYVNPCYCTGEDLLGNAICLLDAAQ